MPTRTTQKQFDLPPGVKRIGTLEGHSTKVRSVAFDPTGTILASGSEEEVGLWDVRSRKAVRILKEVLGIVWSVAFDPKFGVFASGSTLGLNLWDVGSGKRLHTLEEHQGGVNSVAFDPQGGRLASGGHDRTVRLWDLESGKLIRTLEGHDSEVNSVAFNGQGRILASGSTDRTVKLWDADSGKLIRTLTGDVPVWTAVLHPQGTNLASGEYSSVRIWKGGKLQRTLEGHTEMVEFLAFSPDGRLLASKSDDHTIRLWSCETWETVAVIPEPTTSSWIPALAFHPGSPLLASVGSAFDTPQEEANRLINLWELELDVLLGQSAGAVHHTTGKIVLVGDQSVGKSALGHRMIHGEFKEQRSTHGQRFWPFPALGKQRADGTECEAILWDFAGQPDYRLVHALFLCDADLALLLFEASNIGDPLHGVDFWLKQLDTAESRCPTILVAARIDRGTPSLTAEELAAFCERHGIAGPIATSALTGEGVDDLIEQMKTLIPWEDKPATVTTQTFKQIKDYVLGLKEIEPDGRIIVTPEDLRSRLEGTDPDWRFTDAEMMTAVGHLENYGYARRLRTSKGEDRVLLEPERLNNLASSLVLEARRNPRGLGALEEERLLAGSYRLPELVGLEEADRDVLLDSAVVLLLKHNVVFRERDPLIQEPYLVFPELINLKKPAEDEKATEEGVAYTVKGPTENVFASLVVLLGYTRTFTRTSQWQNNARYEVAGGLVCGFRQETERDGEMDFVLGFSPDVGGPIRLLFQGLFESFLARRNLTVMRQEPARCSNGHVLDRSVLRKWLNEGKTFTFCNECGEKLDLPTAAEPIQLEHEVQEEVDAQRASAEQRTQFEQAVYRVRAYAQEQKKTPPSCFISYAWGVPEHERWVETQLARDLEKAGIDVILDRWHNAQIGASIPEFIERIENSDRIVVVGTPLYRTKYENEKHVLASEVHLTNTRLIKQSEVALPLLLNGAEEVSLPPLLHGRVYADFRQDAEYFATAFDLILSLYQLSPRLPAVADLRESLRPGKLR